MGSFYHFSFYFVENHTQLRDLQYMMISDEISVIVTDGRNVINFFPPLMEYANIFKRVLQDKTSSE